MTKSPITENERAESLFRIVGFVIAWACYMILTILIASTFCFATGTFLEGRSFSYPIFIPIFAALIFLANILAWFVIFARPLRHKSQNIGMRLVGCQVYHPDQTPLSWATIIKREMTAGILNYLGLAIFGYLGAVIDRENRTLFDRISGTHVIKTRASIDLINKFRQEQEKKGAYAPADRKGKVE